jgi:hypothetical protein
MAGCGGRTFVWVLLGAILGAAIGFIAGAVVVAVFWHPMVIWQAPSGSTGGMSSAIQPPVSDGDIVLVQKGRAIAAVVLTKQTASPEQVSYRWYYRTDGGGTFRANEAGKYRSGHATDADGFRFGPFAVPWSVHTDGSGYLYYTRHPGSLARSDDLRICATHERDLEKINALDRKWVFKRSPADPGRRLGTGPP